MTTENKTSTQPPQCCCHPACKESEPSGTATRGLLGKRLHQELMTLVNPTSIAL
uniref:Uncharacterized protein n=1 Tax=Rhinolophus ferrumequinum TaxID=59479 RepID=A0A671DQB9_RHIFE